MTDFLTRHYCRVDTGSVVHEGVGVRLLPGRTTAAIIKVNDVLEERPNAAEVASLGPNSWLVKFTDGTTWRVEDMKRPCGCG